MVHRETHHRIHRRSSAQAAPLTVAVCVAALIAGHARGASAQNDPEKIAQARKLFEQGLEQFNQGKFAEACPLFENSLAVVPGVGTRGKLAECYDQLGLAASAWRLYKEVHRLSLELGDERRAEIAAKRVAGLEPRLSRINVDPGPSVAIRGFELRRNDVVIAPREYQSELIVDAGTQVLVASAPGYVSFTASVRIEEGKAATATIPALKEYDPDARPPVRVFRKDTLGVALIALGTVSVFGGGGYYGLRARSRWNEASELCDDSNGCTSEGHSLAGEARRNATIASVLVGVGLASAAAGAFLYWRYRGEGSAPEKPVFTVAPAATEDAVGVTVLGEF